MSRDYFKKLLQGGRFCCASASKTQYWSFCRVIKENQGIVRGKELFIPRSMEYSDLDFGIIEWMQGIATGKRAFMPRYKE